MGPSNLDRWLLWHTHWNKIEARCTAAPYEVMAFEHWDRITRVMALQHVSNMQSIMRMRIHERIWRRFSVG